MTVRLGKIKIASTISNAVWGSIDGTITDQEDLRVALAGKVSVNSPHFEGFPTVPTPSATADDKQITNIGWVNAQIDTKNKQILPSQTNNEGKILSTDGTSVKWIDNLKYDGTTIKSTNNILQAVGIIDQNKKSVKNIWVGTTEEYNKITPNDNTIYHITDLYKIPSIQDNNGKFLKTNGEQLYWGGVDLSNCVFLNGNQTITGQKTFNETIRLQSESSDISLNFVSPNISIDTKPANTHIRSFRMYDGDYNIISQFASLKSKETGNQETFIEARNNISGELIQGKISVYATADGKVVTYAPTPATTSKSTEIATTAFVDAKILNVLNLVYPVGSIYLSVTSTNPLQTLGIGTWSLVSRGRVLQGAKSGQTLGSTLEAGLPNITGEVTNYGNGTGSDISYSGAMYARANGSLVGESEDTQGNSIIYGIDASKSNSIYGNSTTVQPPAYLVNIWRRTA